MKFLNKNQHVIVIPVCVFVRACSGNKRQNRDLLPSAGFFAEGYAYILHYPQKLIIYSKGFMIVNGEFNICLTKSL
jgi:hypothetical protein